MKDMKAGLRFKKSVDKDCNLIYTSPCGFCYIMRRYVFGELHQMQWVKNRDGKFEQVLNRLAETSPEFADRMFANIHRNIKGRKCQQCDSISCGNMAIVKFNGKAKQACGGSMQFQWLPSAFEDVRKVAAAVNQVVKAADEK